jgi:hypothetical protein
MVFVTGFQIMHLASAPLKTPDESVVKQAAAVIKKDFASTGLLLAGKTPKIVAHFQAVSDAQNAARELIALGLVAFIIEDSELRRPFSSFTAHGLRLGKGEVAFSNKAGELNTIKVADVFIVLKGIIQSAVEKETTQTRMKLNLTATLLTGGLPIWRKVKENTTEISSQSEGFIRLYNRASPDAGVEIRQQDFDYSFLGDKLAASSTINFRSLVSIIRDVFPCAVFDDSLTTSLHDIEGNCRLIYLSNQAEIRLKPPI